MQNTQRSRMNTVTGIPRMIAWKDGQLSLTLILPQAGPREKAS